MPAVKGAAPRSPAGARSSASPRRAAPASRPGFALDRRWAVGGAGGVLLLAFTVVLATGGRGRALAATVGHGMDRELAAAGLKVRHVELQGVSAMAAPDVLRAAAVEPGQPIAGLNLDAVRERVEGVGWVRSARVLRFLPDTVVIAAAERPRLAVWQNNGRAVVVDGEGAPIPEADPGRFADLPLVVGEGANEAASAVLPLLRARPRLAGKIEALVRVDARRWDLRLKDGGVIQLPATGEDAALLRLDMLDGRSRLLELGFARIDLRDPDMVTVRPRAAAGAPAAATATATAI